MPLTKYVLAFILVSSVAGVSYVIFENITLRNNLQERNRKITEQNGELQSSLTLEKKLFKSLGTI